MVGCSESHPTEGFDNKNSQVHKSIDFRISRGYHFRHKLVVGIFLGCEREVLENLLLTELFAYAFIAREIKAWSCTGYCNLQVLDGV